MSIRVQKAGSAVMTVAGVLWLLPQLAVAQVVLKETKPSEANPGVERLYEYELTVDPAGEPNPALKYRLLPAPGDRKPGNGAQYYYRALVLFKEGSSARREEFNDLHSKVSDLPLAEIPKDEIRKKVDSYRNVIGELETATTREYCDWDLRLSDLRGYNVIAFLLPEFQESRQLARLLQMKARLEISEGKFDEAIKTLQMGYQLGRDVGKPETLINALVGIAISAIMTDTAQELIAQPGSPNLYWAFAQMPRPFIDIRSALDHELTWQKKMFPLLVDAETANHAPEEWQRLLQETIKELTRSAGAFGKSGDDVTTGLAATGIIMKNYPRAKQEIIDSGHLGELTDKEAIREKVEKMPVAQVVAIHEARISRYIADEMGKWTYLPFWQGKPNMVRTERRLIDEGYIGPGLNSRESIPIMSLLMPAIQQASLATARGDRRFVRMQTLEAIRWHASETGSLPKSLEEITVAPVPMDPYSGKPLPYQLDGDTATIDLRQPKEFTAGFNEVFRIKLRGK